MTEVQLEDLSEPGLITLGEKPLAHLLDDITITHIGLDDFTAGLVQGNVQSHVRHNRSNDCVLLEYIAFQHVDAADSHEVVTINLIAMLIDEDTPVGIPIEGNAEELCIAFSNLITNAIRYTPEGKDITIKMQRRNNDASISVKDQGIGIEAEHIPRLTERFYRVDPGRSREQGGTGLGLPIVSDEIYDGLVYDGERAPSALEVTEDGSLV